MTKAKAIHWISLMSPTYTLCGRDIAKPPIKGELFRRVLNTTKGNNVTCSLCITQFVVYEKQYLKEDNEAFTKVDQP